MTFESIRHIPVEFPDEPGNLWTLAVQTVTADGTPIEADRHVRRREEAVAAVLGRSRRPSTSTPARLCRLCRLNLAVHGLEGEIKLGGNINSNFDDPHDANGRGGFVMANSTSDGRASEQEIRQKLIESRAVDVGGGAILAPCN